MTARSDGKSQKPATAKAAGFFHSSGSSSSPLSLVAPGRCGLPPIKQNIHIRLDTDILEWFKAHGTGYQTRINAVLRAYVASQANKRRNNHTP